MRSSRWDENRGRSPSLTLTLTTNLPPIHPGEGQGGVVSCIKRGLACLQDSKLPSLAARAWLLPGVTSSSVLRSFSELTPS